MTKQLIYLHKVLQKQESHWTRTTLQTLKHHNIGWARQVENSLDEWDLETNWDVIKTKSANAWKKVYEAAERKNRQDFLKNATKRKEETPSSKPKQKDSFQFLKMTTTQENPNIS